MTTGRTSGRWRNGAGVRPALGPGSEGPLAPDGWNGGFWRFSGRPANLAPMTKLLEMALTKAAELSDAEQDRIAQLVLNELEEEARW